jgi:hypothetical protein
MFFLCVGGITYHELLALLVARQEQLLTVKGPLKVPAVNECYSHKHKETILNAAKSIISLSAYLGIPYYLISTTVSTLHNKLLVNYNQHLCRWQRD